MREKFLKYADNLIAQENVEKVYENLIEIFSDNCMFHEEGACNEKLWHITQKPELYKKVGDIFANKVRNPNIAFNAYNRYLQFLDKDFYKSYAQTARRVGISDIDRDLDNEDYSKQIIRLCDTYDTIVYMMICLLSEKDFDGVLELDKKLSSALSNINKYIRENHISGEKDYLEDNEASRRHLSEMMSKTAHHNDINLLAIKYDRNNKQAYMNIIGDYITYKNYNDAILFFNYTYCKAFDIPEKDSIIDICWEVSDFYRDKYDFYNAVLFQKHALELEGIEV